MRLQINNSSTTVTMRDVAMAARPFIGSAVFGVVVYYLMVALQGDPYTRRAEFAAGHCPQTGWDSYARVYTCATDVQRDAAIAAAAHAIHTVALLVAGIAALAVFIVLLALHTGTCAVSSRRKPASGYRTIRTTPACTRSTYRG